MNKITVKALKLLLFQEQSFISDNYKNLELTGDVKITKEWIHKNNTNFGIFFDLIERGDSIRCVLWTPDKNYFKQIKETMNQKSCIVKGNLTVDKIFHNFQLTIKSIELNKEQSKMEEMKNDCIKFKLFENKKCISWKNVLKMTILSKKNTQGYCDFIQQLQIPIDVTLLEIPLEGPDTAKEIIKHVKYCNAQKNCNVISIIRGGGNTTDISSSFDDLELFKEMKKSKIPIITAIGHANDTDENLFITQISDKDYATPTSFAKSINSDIFEIIQDALQKRIRSIHQRYMTLITDEQFKVFLQLQKELEISKYHIIDLSHLSENEEIIFFYKGKYYQQNVDMSREIQVDKESLKNRLKISSFMEEKNIKSLFEFLKDKKCPDKILGLCKQWLEYEKKEQKFQSLKPNFYSLSDFEVKSCYDWKKLEEYYQQQLYIETTFIFTRITKKQFRLLQESLNI